MPKMKSPVHSHEAKLKTSVLISPEAVRLVEALSEKLVVSKSAVWELAVRELARREKVS